MFDKLFKKKEPIKNINIHQNDVALRLMFEIAISDGKLNKAELSLIKKRADKIIVGDEKASTIIKKINEAFTKDEKLELLENLWELVAIDDVIDMYEESLYFKIAELIKIKRSAANQIKQQAT